MVMCAGSKVRLGSARYKSTEAYAKNVGLDVKTGALPGPGFSKKQELIVLASLYRMGRVCSGYVFRRTRCCKVQHRAFTGRDRPYVLITKHQNYGGAVATSCEKNSPEGHPKPISFCQKQIKCTREKSQRQQRTGLLQNREILSGKHDIDNAQKNSAQTVTGVESNPCLPHGCLVGQQGIGVFHLRHRAGVFRHKLV